MDIYNDFKNLVAEKVAKAKLDLSQATPQIEYLQTQIANQQKLIADANAIIAKYDQPIADVLSAIAVQAQTDTLLIEKPIN